MATNVAVFIRYGWLSWDVRPYRSALPTIGSTREPRNVSEYVPYRGSRCSRCDHTRPNVSVDELSDRSSDPALLVSALLP